MKDQVWVLQVAFGRQSTWWPCDLGTRKQMAAARGIQQAKYPKLRYRVRKFVEAPGQ